MTIAAIAATALTMSTIDSTAASTVTLKDGQLVYSDTGKIVSGYKVYKNKLYKNGVLATGRVKYGTGANMKLYKDGSLIKGVYKHETNHTQDLIFKEGILTNKIIVDNYKLYENGVCAYNTIVKQYEDTLAEILALKSDIGTVSDDDISATLKAKTMDLVTLVKEEKFSLYTEYGGGRDEDGEYFNSEAMTRKIGGELQKIVEMK